MTEALCVKHTACCSLPFEPLSCVMVNQILLTLTYGGGKGNIMLQTGKLGITLYRIDFPRKLAQPLKNNKTGG